MTGYRAFNAVFAKTMPVLSPGFEIETELSIHAVDKRWRIAEVPIDYRDRPAGSVSKLSTFSDGTKVLLTILSLFKDYRPLVLFSWLALLFCVLGLFAGVPVVVEFMQTGLVRSCRAPFWPWRSCSWACSASPPGSSWTRWSKARARSTSWRSPAPTSDTRAAEVRGKAESGKGRMGDAPLPYCYGPCLG